MERMFTMQLFKSNLQNAPSSTHGPILTGSACNTRFLYRDSARFDSPPPLPAGLLALRQHLMDEL